jgi:pilus assembly protein CpaE
VDRIRAAQNGSSWKSKRICVIGSSGGAGATTIACNLAVELANLINHQCALIDLDLLLGDVGCFLDTRPSYSVADLCCDGIEIDSAMLAQGFHDLPSKVSILARPERQEEALEVAPSGIENMLAVARETYPFIVVDLPRSLGQHSAAALKQADLVLIITQLGVSFVRNASRVYESIRQMGVPEDAIEIVVNRHKGDAAHITPDDVEEHFRKPLFALIPNDYRRVKSSVDLGRAILTHAPKSPVRTAINEMARTIAIDHPHHVHTHDRSPRQGVLQRLLRWKHNRRDTYVHPSPWPAHRSAFGAHPERA